MDNDLLSKSKLIDWLEEKIESYFLAYHNSHSDYDQGREASYHEVIESVRSGLFDPDPTPSPTIKPGEVQYVCPECKSASTSNEWNIATLKVYGSDIYLIEDDNKAITTFFVCPKCGSNVDFDCLEVSHD